MDSGTPAGDARSTPRLTYVVKQLELAVRGELNRRLKPLGLTALQYTALSVLARQAGISSAQLARRSFVTPQAANEIVVALERAGLIERTEDPQNRRVLRTSLTATGRDALRRCDTIVDDLEATMTGSVDPADVDDLRSTLLRLLHGLAPGHRI